MWMESSGATGAPGHSRLGQSLLFPGPKAKIIVYADPNTDPNTESNTGRMWWEDVL